MMELMLDKKKTLFSIGIIVLLFFIFLLRTTNEVVAYGESCSWPENEFPLYPGGSPADEVAWPYPNPHSHVCTPPDANCSSCHYIFKGAVTIADVHGWYKEKMPSLEWKELAQTGPMGDNEAYLYFSKELLNEKTAYATIWVRESTYPAYFLNYSVYGAGTYFPIPTIPPTTSSTVTVTPSPTPTPISEICVYSPEVEARRQEILTRLRQKYKFDVLDSNLCGQTTCGDNSLWSERELLEIEAALDKLPGCFTDKLALTQIRGRQGNEPLFSSIWEQACCETTEEGKITETQSGLMGGYLSLEEKLTFCDRWYQKEGHTLEELLTHELTHAFQQGGAIAIPRLPYGPYTNPLVISWLLETGWAPNGWCLPVIGCNMQLEQVPPDLPNNYARKTRDPLEDMAESVRLYVTNPEELLTISPRRYDFIKENIMCGHEYRQ